MLISSGADWVQVSTLSIYMQKAGLNNLRLAYSEAKPVDPVISFALSHNLVETYPRVVDKGIWVKAGNGDVTISYEEVTPSGGGATYGTLTNIEILAIASPSDLENVFSSDDRIIYTYYSGVWNSTAGGVLV